MTQKFQWTQSAVFYERVERLNLHGLHFQHVDLCVRRAWMYLHRINFAQWNSSVEAGAAKHETSYRRDHSTLGLIGLSPDRIDWENRIAYEHKGSGGSVEAVNDQAAFYALMLSIATGLSWSARVKVVGSSRERKVDLDEVRLQRLWDSSMRLEELSTDMKVPDAKRQRLCSACSFAIFCGYG